MPGKIKITLPDGSEYDYKSITAELTNLVSNERTVNIIGETQLEDKTNGYNLKVIFDSK